MWIDSFFRGFFEFFSHFVLDLFNRFISNFISDIINYDASMTRQTNLKSLGFYHKIVFY